MTILIYLSSLLDDRDILLKYAENETIKEYLQK